MTALQLNGSNVASAVVSTAFQFAPATGGTETSGTVTIASGATGWFEHSPGVTGTITLAASEPTGPSGKQFFLDGSTLDGQNLTSGTFTFKITFSSTRGFTFTAVARLWIYDGTTYTQIGSDIASSSTTVANSLKTTYSWTGTPPAQAFVSGKHLTVDYQIHVTTGPVGGTASIGQFWSTSATTGVASDAEVDTAGYTPNTTTQAVSVTETATGSELAVIAGLTLASVSITESDAGAVSPDQLAITEIVTEQGLTLASVAVSESDAGTEIVAIANIVESPCSANMQLFDLVFQSTRINGSITGQFLKFLATTYYSNAADTVIFGELDALFTFETIDKLHAMRTVCDVNAFLQAYEYLSNVLTDTPAVYYRLSEASGATAFDVAGRAMNGTINGNVTLGQAGPLNKSSDTSMLFDGTTGYIQLPAAVKTDNWSGLAVEAWVNLSNITFSNSARILANDVPDSTNLGFSFFVTKNSLNLRVGVGNTFHEIPTGYTFAASTWYHLAAAFDGRKLYTYVNGVLQNSTFSPFTLAVIAPTTGPVYISRNPGDLLNGLPGKISQAAIYNYPLSASRVLAHYNSGINP